MVRGYYKVHFRFIWFSDIMEDASFHVRYDCIYGLYIVRVASPSTKKGIIAPCSLTITTAKCSHGQKPGNSARRGDNKK